MTYFMQKTNLHENSPYLEVIHEIEKMLWRRKYAVNIFFFVTNIGKHSDPEFHQFLGILYRK